MLRERLVENIFVLFPRIFKKLMKGLPKPEISKQQIEFLLHMSSNNGKTMSYYSNMMMISKPNLTVLADKMIDDGYIERVFDPNDRRVVLLNITEKGKIVLCQHKEIMKGILIKRFEKISEDEVIRLNELIDEIGEILEKVIKENNID